jgi:hypothetical protein
VHHHTWPSPHYFFGEKQNKTKQKQAQKGCSTSFIVREMRIKTTVKHYFTATRKITSVDKNVGASCIVVGI